MCGDKSYVDFTTGVNKSIKESFPELKRLEREADDLLTGVCPNHAHSTTKIF
jgi:hypothetical protein